MGQGASPKGQIIKFLEFFSIVGFGLAYWRYDLQVATIVLMGLMTLYMVMAKIWRVPLTKLQVGTWVVVVGLGIATILFQDERFIKWKTTVINGGLAIALSLSHLLGDKTLLERLLSEKFKAPRAMLRRVNLALAVHFLIIAILNLVFAYNFATTIWVNFKLFGILLLNLTFMAGAMFYLRASLKEFLATLEKEQNS